MCTMSISSSARATTRIPVCLKLTSSSSQSLGNIWLPGKQYLALSVPGSSWMPACTIPLLALVVPQPTSASFSSKSRSSSYLLSSLATKVPIMPPPITATCTAFLVFAWLFISYLQITVFSPTRLPSFLRSTGSIGEEFYRRKFNVFYERLNFCSYNATLVQGLDENATLREGSMGWLHPCTASEAQVLSSSFPRVLPLQLWHA